MLNQNTNSLHSPFRLSPHCLTAIWKCCRTTITETNKMKFQQRPLTQPTLNSTDSIEEKRNEYQKIKIKRTSSSMCMRACFCLHRDEWWVFWIINNEQHHTHTKCTSELTFNQIVERANYVNFCFCYRTRPFLKFSSIFILFVSLSLILIVFLSFCEPQFKLIKW